MFAGSFRPRIGRRDGSLTSSGVSTARACAMKGAMARRNRYLTATMPDGYVKTIGPTAQPFTHYWRIVAELGGGRTEVFWGHAKSRKAAMANDAAMAEAARQRGWVGHRFEVVELVESDAPPEGEPTSRRPGKRR